MLNLPAAMLAQLDALIATQGTPAPTRAEAVRDIVTATLLMVGATSLMGPTPAKPPTAVKRIIDRAQT